MALTADEKLLMMNLIKVGCTNTELGEKARKALVKLGVIKKIKTEKEK